MPGGRKKVQDSPEKHIYFHFAFVFLCFLHSPKQTTNSLTIVPLHSFVGRQSLQYRSILDISRLFWDLVLNIAGVSETLFNGFVSYLTADADTFLSLFLTLF